MISELDLLLSGSTPIPFIYLHHTHHPASTIFPNPFPRNCVIVKLDAIEHYNPRLFFSCILNRLASAVSEGDSDEFTGEIGNWDAFSRGLKAVWERSEARATTSGVAKGVKGNVKGKGKLKEVILAEGKEAKKVVLIVTKAERLRNVLGPGWSVVTRLAELTGLPATVILASQVPWDELRPPRGDALEPLHIFLPPLTRQETLKQLLPGSSHPLYPRFIDLLLTTVQPLDPNSPPVDMEYLSEILWPIYTSSLPPHAEQILLNRPYPNPSSSEPAPPPPPPPLQITVKLLTELKHQSSLAFTAAIENVLPRLTGRTEFLQAFIPPSWDSHRHGHGHGHDGSVNGFGVGFGHGNGDGNGFILGGGVKGLPKPPPLELPICAKHLLIAGYCASYNPPKSDMRLFGRGLGDGKRRRGGGGNGGTRRAGYGRTRIGKVPQRLLGPKPFPLDRLLAIFASIFAEHAERPEDLQASIGQSGTDSESESATDSDDVIDGPKRRKMNGERWLPSIDELAARATKRRKREVERDERWEDEVEHLTMSVKLWSLIPELENQGLLRRMSPPERLDNVMLRCEVDYETVRLLARELKITLDEYLYEAVL